MPLEEGTAVELNNVFVDPLSPTASHTIALPPSYTQEASAAQPSVTPCAPQYNESMTLEGSFELMNAAKNGNISMVAALLAQGVDVNSQDEDGGTGLMIASETGHVNGEIRVCYPSKTTFFRVVLIAALCCF